MSLPQEIFDMIIDNLCEDVPALQACSLTSRVWYPHCRRYIHSKLTFDGGDPDTLRRIELYIVTGLINFVNTFVLYNLSTHLPSVLSSGIFSKVRSITIMEADWTLNDMRVQHYLASMFPSVKALNLVYRNTFDGPSKLVYLIQSFPSLNALSISDANINRLHSAMTMLIKGQMTRPHLTSLCIAYPHYTHYGEKEILALQNICEVAGPSLSHLRLHFDKGVTTTAYDTLYSTTFQDSFQLQSLTLVFPFVIGLGPASQFSHLASLLVVLFKLRCTRELCIQIVSGIEDEEAVRHSQLSLVDEVVVGRMPIGKELQEVVFILPPKISDPTERLNIRRGFEAYMSTSHQRGILKIKFEQQLSERVF